MDSAKKLCLLCQRGELAVPENLVVMLYDGAIRFLELQFGLWI